MAEVELHRWDVTPAEAREIQLRLRNSVRVEPIDLAAIHSVTGSDISFNQRSEEVFAGFVTVAFPELTVVASSGLRTQATFPYVPGLLSFRETPPLLEAWERLDLKPDALVVDGHGYAHPRRFGIACHLGVLLDLPTVGCAKSILVGTHEPAGETPGEWQPLVHQGETVGAALRTRAGTAPVYVSIGHRCDLETAIALVSRCALGYRIPEPTRQAHLFVNQLRRVG